MKNKVSAETLWKEIWDTVGHRYKDMDYKLWIAVNDKLSRPLIKQSMSKIKDDVSSIVRLQVCDVMYGEFKEWDRLI